MNYVSQPLVQSSRPKRSRELPSKPDSNDQTLLPTQASPHGKIFKNCCTFMPCNYGQVLLMYLVKHFKPTYLSGPVRK